jgi:hypothetical protein
MSCKSLSNFAASACRTARTSSVIESRTIIVSEKFFRGTNDRWFKPRFTAYPFDLFPHDGIGNMLEIPRQ